MKTKLIFTTLNRSAFLLLLSTFFHQPSTLLAQGNAFTYQGRLNDGGAPANGSYDFQFYLRDAATVGNPVGPTNTLAPVAVSNGLFTVTLDFGAGTFTGSARWLETGVRTNGSVGAYSTLSPRQPVSPTPYAIFAGTSSNVVTGSVVASLNGLKDNVTLTAGSNVVITPGGNTLTIASAGAGGSGIWSVNGNNTYYTAGNVGIGTSTPAHRLSLIGGPAWTAQGWTGSLELPNSGAIGWQTDAAGQRFGMGHTGGGFYMFRTGSNPGNTSSNALYDFVMDDSGRVGLGTTTPQAKLHLYDPNLSVSQLLETAGGINSWTKTSFKNLNGQWDIGTSRGFNNDVFYMDRLGNASLEFQLAANGNLGLGIEPIAKLHLYDPTSSVSERIETSGGVNAWTRIEFANANGQWNVGTSRGFNSDQFFIQREGQSVGFAVQTSGDAFVAGNASVCSLTVRGGCDLAEPFQVKEENVDKGAVVVIDEEHPGRLKLSTRAYDTRVAGIVSGANGINPGIALRQEGALEEGPQVALSGRVYVQADASYGDICPGDLLTTSNTPGYAMKVTDHAQAQGAILGKAMSGLKEGRGMVLVLVTLQ